ncbi:hypothetical protein NZ30_05790 [Xanthomonas translucens pv. undulosa]|nr:hypothetical protein NZ30_05790 [Xanthomonas translucens pv. undulosa]
MPPRFICLARIAKEAEYLLTYGVVSDMPFGMPLYSELKSRGAVGNCLDDAIVGDGLDSNPGRWLGHSLVMKRINLEPIVSLPEDIGKYSVGYDPNSVRWQILLIAGYVHGLAVHYAELRGRQMCHKRSALLNIHFLQPAANAEDWHIQLSCDRQRDTRQTIPGPVSFPRDNVVVGTVPTALSSIKDVCIEI